MGELILTSNTKRQVVARFMSGKSLTDIAEIILNHEAKSLRLPGWSMHLDDCTRNLVEPVIRDYINGKFALKGRYD